jgi:hypothetical protein
MEKNLIVDKEIGLLKFFKESKTPYSFNFTNLRTLMLCRKRLKITCPHTNLSDLPPEVFFKEIFEKYLIKKIKVKLVSSVKLIESGENPIFSSDYHEKDFPIYTFCLSEKQFDTLRLIDILRFYSSLMSLPPTNFKVIFAQTEDEGKTFHHPFYVYPNIGEMYESKTKDIPVFSEFKKRQMFLQLVPLQRSFIDKIPIPLQIVNYEYVTEQ